MDVSNYLALLTSVLFGLGKLHFERISRLTDPRRRVFDFDSLHPNIFLI